METTEFNLPSYWASALINDDCSGLDANEENDMNQWYMKNAAGLACINVSEDTFFGQFQGLGYELATYTFTDYNKKPGEKIPLENIDPANY